MKKTIERIIAFASRAATQTEIQMANVDFLQKHLYNNEKYQNPSKLNLHEFSAFSQNGEDGIIEEIFKRIGTTNQFFVEFGTESGVETNSTYLLYKGWKGVFIDGSRKNVEDIHNFFSGVISQSRLQVLCSFITAENIETLLDSADVPKELDFLSIDIDRNDYYVWNAIKAYRPRVVCIEYNAVFRPGCEFVVPYEATSMWDGSSHTGASLESLYKLGIQKGYKLVGCCFAGVNAFFVREDLVKNLFVPPFTPDNHYEPPRYFLASHRGGHPRKIIL
ncbi:MAG: hypothetical protein LBS01_07045 [Prevotellaceae bacterium]|jgi:hypothetical protein|nr:hypothetical protein [Prevotellaceae bacterium]